MLDLLRLGEGRWLARAVVRIDGVTVALEETLDSEGVPRVEAVIDLEADPPALVLRHRDAPSIVFASRQLPLTDTNRERFAGRDSTLA